MKALVFVLGMLLALPFYAAEAPTWGKTGHRATGAIAQQYLTKKAARTIKELLEGRNLAYVSTYGDEIKSDASYRQYGPWHYVNFPFDTNYETHPKSEKGDIIQAIETCIQKLKNQEYDAIILSQAGLVRLNLEHLITEVLDFKLFLPAACQGAVGVQALKSSKIKKVVSIINDPQTQTECMAERRVLKNINANLSYPHLYLNLLTAANTRTMKSSIVTCNQGSAQVARPEEFTDYFGPFSGIFWAIFGAILRRFFGLSV